MWKFRVVIVRLHNGELTKQVSNTLLGQDSFTDWQHALEHFKGTDADEIWGGEKFIEPFFEGK